MHRPKISKFWKKIISNNLLRLKNKTVESKLKWNNSKIQKTEYKAQKFTEFYKKTVYDDSGISSRWGKRILSKWCENAAVKIWQKLTAFSCLTSHYKINSKYKLWHSKRTTRNYTQIFIWCQWLTGFLRYKSKKEKLLTCLTTQTS